VDLTRPLEGAPVGVAAVEVDVVTSGVAARRRDAVAMEEPLQISVVHGPAHDRAELDVAVTMRTPGDDVALALGFLHGEGVLRTGDDVAAVSEGENTVGIELAPTVAFDAVRLTRNVYTSSSCGICGLASIEAVRVRIPDRAGHDAFAIGPAVLGGLPAGLRAAQAAFERTGGLHASGAFDREGRIVAVAEDVGRHNALDKLIGRLLQDGALPLSDRGLVFSGRASFELVQKAAMAGCPFVAAIGPPSSLAVELAAEQRMTLVGFLREERFNVYTLPHRVRLER
jgi:FdhD protein